MSSKDIIPHFRASVSEHGRVYEALTNMPRANPQKATEAHGEVMTPYIAALLYLAAREGGSAGVVDYLRRRPIETHNEDPMNIDAARTLDALVQDLRNGMAFYPVLDRIVVEDIVGDRARIFGFFTRKQIPFEFAVRGMTDEDDKEKAKKALAALEEPIRKPLQLAVDRSVDFAVICHPGVDGTRTGNAERALGVPAERVLKCLIFKADGSEYIAALCVGSKVISESMLKVACGCSELRLATKDEVRDVTGHKVGGVPVTQVFDMVKAVYISSEVIEQGTVYGSAGSEFAGVEIPSGALVALGGKVVEITHRDSNLRENEQAIRKQLERIERAMRREDRGKAIDALEKIRQLLTL
jgi:prolyl-tRNA editing enzyme YbaK/EbsC (Cys-tRNA(Pro) deacylase)